MLPKPGSQEWEDVADFMRTDLESGMQLTKIEITARKIVEEFEKWKNEKNNTHIMKIECAWCGLDMGTKPCNEGQQDMISHGICDSCKIKMKEEIAEYRR